MRFMGKTEDRYIVPGLARGLDVLQAFSPSQPSLSLGELAARLGCSRSALFRITYTLTSLGFLTQDTMRKTFSPGPALLRLGHGSGAARPLVEAALPALEALRDATGCAAHLGVLEGREVVYLLRLGGAPAIVQVGSRLPAHATAMGRVLLAGLAEDDLLERYRDATLPRITPRAPASPQGVLAQARRDLKRGHVLHLGDFESRIASMAAPVPGVLRAAISITAALDQEQPLERHLPRLLATAETIAAALPKP
jgi:DNA-binding IclR family transcriptional regulator